MPQVMPSPFRMVKPPAGCGLDLTSNIAPKGAQASALQFLEGSGLTTLDAVQANEVALTNVVWKPGAFGPCPNLNGTTSYVRAGKIGNAIASDFAFSIWFNISNISSSPVLVFKGLSGVSGYYLQFQGTGGTALSFFSAAPSSINTASPASTIASGVTTHVVVNKKGTQVRFFVNGKGVEGTYLSDGTHTGPVDASANDLLLGCYNAASNFCAGWIDDFKFFPYALTPDQAWALYNEPYAMLRGPDAWWR